MAFGKLPKLSQERIEERFELHGLLVISDHSRRLHVVRKESEERWDI